VISRVTLNPVLARELTERMRGRRAAVLITIYLSLLTLILWLVYESATPDQDGFSGFDATRTATVGRSVFGWVLFFMMLIILFLIPAQTAGAIAGERERQTLRPLQITLLSPLSILLGKLGASMAFLVLLVVAAMPLLSIAYLIGGVTIAEVLGATSLVVATGVALGALCTSVSVFTKRVQTATVLSYGVTLALVVGTFMTYGAAAIIDSSRGIDEANPPGWLIMANPLATVGDYVGEANFASNGVTVFDGIKQLTDPREDDQFVEFDAAPPPVPLGPDGEVVINDIAGGRGGAFPDPGDPGVPYWFWSLLLLLSLASLAIWRASRRLRTPAELER
jgi:ABC-2 type transport system permease protein